jgi:hypothetical protein
LAAHAYASAAPQRAAAWAGLCRAWLPHVPDLAKGWYLEKDPDLTAGYLNAIAPANSVVRGCSLLKTHLVGECV